MPAVAKMFIYFAYYLLVVVDVAMFARAILSWIVPDGDGVLLQFIYAITEPFLIPVRKLFYRFNIGTGFPLDLSFFVTMILISVLMTVFRNML